MLNLNDINHHPRDDRISFQDEGHIYTLEGISGNPVSTTQTIGKFYKHFDADKVLDMMFKNNKDPDAVYKGNNEKYRGKTRSQIKTEWKDTGEDASGKGTFMHKDIENYINGDEVVDPNSQEFQKFLKFYNDYFRKNPGHKPYRTEWLVWDDTPGCKDVLAGSIDFVVEDENGNLILIDWKRSKEIKKSSSYENKFGDIITPKMYKPFENLDDCNYYHYSLQLNFYRHILEILYGKKVVGMMLVVLHPNREVSPEEPVDIIDLNPIWHTLR